MTTIRVALEHGRAQEALKLAKLAVHQNPINAQAWVFIGDALDKLNRPYESWQAYRRGWLLDPSATWAGPIQNRLRHAAPVTLDVWLQQALAAPEVTVTAAILARNEERSIKRCIESLHEAVDDIIVVDTGSTDNTVAIATECGAKVYEFEWCDDFSKARNFALQYISSQWVLWIDADEWLDPEHLDAPKIAAGLFNTLARPLALRVVQVNQLPDRLDINYDMSRMHPMGYGIHWRGRIHEQLTPADGNFTNTASLTTAHVTHDYRSGQ